MLTLGITTSSGQFALVLSEDKKILYIDKNVNLDQKKELFVILIEGLNKIGKQVQDITEIIVDNGPGGTSSVRTGVSFANSLAYGLKIPVCPVASFELIGLELWQKYQLPVIITAKSIKNNAFIAYFNNNELGKIIYGKISENVKKLIDNKEVIVAGAHQEMISDLLDGICIVNKSGVLRANPYVLIENRERFAERSFVYPKIVYPVTEQNV